MESWLGTAKIDQDMSTFKSTCFMISNFQEECVLHVLALEQEVKVGKRGVRAAELKGRFGVDMVEKIVSLVEHHHQQGAASACSERLIMAGESPQKG